MISAVVGRPGQGKTLYLVDQIIKNAEWREVYTNVDVRLPDRDRRKKRIHVIDSFDEVVRLREGLIVLDEIQVYLNSRKWDSLDERFQLLLQQHRKRGLDILGATQSIRRADVVFRELIQNFYTISKIYAGRMLGITTGAFIMREYDPDSIESSTGNFEAIGWPWLFYADPYIFRVYDTTQEYMLKSRSGRKEIITYEVVDKVVTSKKVVDKIYVDDSDKGDISTGDSGSLESGSDRRFPIIDVNRGVLTKS